MSTTKPVKFLLVIKGFTDPGCLREHVGRSVIKPKLVLPRGGMGNVWVHWTDTEGATHSTAADFIENIYRVDRGVPAR